jgi:hypothetical protein
MAGFLDAQFFQKDFQGAELGEAALEKVGSDKGGVAHRFCAQAWHKGLFP